MQTSTLVYRLILMFGIVGANAFFAGAEAALISSRRARLRALAERGHVGAVSAMSLLGNPERLLSVVQVGVTLTSLALGWVGQDTLFTYFVSWMPARSSPYVEMTMRGGAVALAFLLMTFLHVVLGEVVPKNLAIEKRERVAVLVAPPLLVFSKAAGPFVWIIESAASAVSRAIGVHGEPHSGAHSTEELKFVLSATRAAGHLSSFEEEAIGHLLDLEEYAAREVMVPRNALVTVPLEADIDDVLAVFSESRYSRLPVYEGSKDNIIGIVHVKDVLEYWTERRQSNLKRRGVAPFELKNILRRVPIVPETKPLTQLLTDLRARHAQVAFVVDEFGTIAGLVTMEDILEQVVGEIEDEFDPVYLPRAPDADSVEVEGIIPIRDLDTHYGIELPSDLEFETLAGFLLYRLGRIPGAGNQVEHDGRRYTILTMDHNRIARVRIDRL